MTEDLHSVPSHPRLDEATIHALVHGFYARARDDEMLGPIFNRAIGDDWDAHLRKMCDFWSSVMLQTGRYKGNPMIAHTRQKLIQPRHFERWLLIFHQTALDVCPQDTAQLFIDRAENIAKSLQLGMFYRPNGTP